MTILLSSSSSPSRSRWCPGTTSAAILSCIILATTWTSRGVVVVSAEDSTCEMLTSCEECLQSPCAFYNGPGCIDETMIIADIARYVVVDDRVETVSDVCQKAANDRADSTLCGGMADCSSCVEAILSDGESTCVWFEQFEFCSNEVCGLAGCGSDSCGASRETRPPVPVEEAEEATTTTAADSICFQTTASCEECLSNTGAVCTWVPALAYESSACLEVSCDKIADPKCFSMESATGSDTPAEICGGGEAPETEVDAAEAGSGAPAGGVRLWLSTLLLVLAWNQ